MKEKAKEFRAGWSHEPIPIPPDASGLWYSEGCADEMLADFAREVLEEAAKIAEANSYGPYNHAAEHIAEAIRQMKEGW